VELTGLFIAIFEESDGQAMPPGETFSHATLLGLATNCGAQTFFLLADQCLKQDKEQNG
jgi:hypothetical protein